MKHVVVITGAAGYVGSMLVQQIGARDDVSRVIGIDKEPLPDMIKDEQKLTYIQANLSDGTWQKQLGETEPDIIIHTAWQIRMLYGHNDTTWKWNVDGSRALFEFAFGTPSVQRLVHFSTVSGYGAYETNTFEHRFKEDEAMRETQYLYGVEKIAAEVELTKVVEAAGGKGPEVAVVRPAAITGPRGRYMRIRFGLQAALSGQLKGGVYGLVSVLVSLVPATKGWVRQFIHEDDVVDLVTMLAFDPWKGGRMEVFNITPPGEPVYAADMARAVGKKTLPIQPWMARVAYFFFWHGTRGKIPTAPGSWRFYSYPLVVDGTKLTNLWGYKYQHESFDAFYYTNGRYESFVPETALRHKEYGIT
jgi:nucleoside-diphosphate-sugar epimerase